MKHKRAATWLGLVLGACFAFLLNAHAQVSEDSGQLTEEFHNIYPLSSNGTVQLENINGSVHISAWDRSEVKLDAIKHAWSRERLGEAKIVVEASANSVSIRTVYPHDHTRNGDRDVQNNPASVEYTLVVPSGARLDEIKLVNGSLNIQGAAGEIRASCVNGKLIARSLSGSVKFSTVNGTMEAQFDRVAGNQIELSSVNGSLDVMIPSDSKAVVEASTMQGSISDDFGLHEHHQLVGHNLRGEIGGGGTAIKLSNVNGSIEIRRNYDGRTLSPAKDSDAGDRDDI